MTTLIHYDEACRAVAEALTIDEARDIRDKADAVRAYARQARNRELELKAAEIRFRAERRIGELKLELREAGKLHEGGRPSKKTSAASAEVSSKVKLVDLGVDEKLSVRAERLASIETNSFDRLLERWRARQAEEGDRVSVNLLKEEDEAKKREERSRRVFAGGTVGNLEEMIAAGITFPAILADPPWHFVARSEKGEGRSAGTHYKTEKSGLDLMKELPIAKLAAEDCILFMWMVDWCPQDALDLIKAWGFEHKTTAFTWAKQNPSGEGFHMGQGYWTRANPEACWLATRGHPKRLNADVRQLLVAPVEEHSRKPDIVHDRIERLVDGPYLELYARRPRDKWVTWGNELAFVMPEPFDPETGELSPDPQRGEDDAARAARGSGPVDVFGGQGQSANEAGASVPASPSDHSVDATEKVDPATGEVIETESRSESNEGQSRANGRIPGADGVASRLADGRTSDAPREGENANVSAGVTSAASEQAATELVRAFNAWTPNPVPAPGSPAPESEGIQAGASNNQGGPASDSDNSNSDLGNGAGAAPELAPAPTSRPSDEDMAIPPFLDVTHPDYFVKGQAEL